MTEEEYNDKRPVVCLHETGHIVYGVMVAGLDFDVCNIGDRNTLEESCAEWNDYDDTLPKEISAMQSIAGVVAQAQYDRSYSVAELTHAIRNHEMKQTRDAESDDYTKARRNFTDEELADLIDTTFTPDYFSQYGGIYSAVYNWLCYHSQLTKQQLVKIIAENMGIK